VLCGLRPELSARLARTELEAVLGPGAFFESGGRPFESVDRALAHVRSELSKSRAD
jgi:hypothetical protein